MEAASKLLLDGVVNEYELNTDGLNIIDLESGDYNVLNWMALLFANRLFALDQPLAVHHGISSSNGLALMYPKPTS